MNFKYTTVASAILFFVSINASQAVQVYKNEDSSLDIIGRVKIDIQNNDASSDKRLIGTSRLGVQGNTKANDYLSVFGKVQWDLQAQETNNEADKIKIRYGFVGLNFNQYGKFTFGRLEDSFYKTTKPTDIFYNWGKKGVTYWGFTSNDYGGRQDGQAIYDLSYNGFTLSASYRFRDTSKYLNYGAGATIGYEFDLGDSPLGILAGYNHYEGYKSGTKRGWEVKEGDTWTDKHDLFYGADKNEAAISLYYGARGTPGLYTAILYNYGKLENTYKGSGFNGVISYVTPSGMFNFYGSYGYIKNCDEELTMNAKNKKLNNNRSILSETFTLGIDYNLTSNFVIYLEGEHRADSVFNQKTENLGTLGLIYNF